jgi:hypothetical protein
MFRQLLLLVRQRRPYLVEESGLACAQVAKIRARFGETQNAVRPTTDFIRIMVILTVVFPKANGTDFVVRSPIQSLEPAAWALI